MLNKVVQIRWRHLCCSSKGPSYRGTLFFIIGNIYNLICIWLVEKWITTQAFSRQIKKKLISIKVFLDFSCRIRFSNLGVDPLWCGMFTVGQHPRGSLGLFLATSMTTIEATKREPQRDATGAIAAPTPTDHSTSYPSGGASRKSWPQAQFFSLFDRPNRSKTLRSTQNTEGTRKPSMVAIAVAAPRVAF